MERDHLPKLNSAEGKALLANYGRWNLPLLISTIILSILGILASFVDEMEGTALTVSLIVLIVLGITSFAVTVFSIWQEAKDSKPALQMVMQYVEEVMQANAESYDLTRNVTEYTLAKDNDHSTYVLHQDGTGQPITFDRTLVTKQKSLDMLMGAYVINYLKWQYLLRVEEGKVPLQVQVSDHTGKKVQTEHIVVNGALHKSINRKVLQPLSKDIK